VVVVAGAPYRLATVGGEELGERSFNTYEWEAGDRIPPGRESLEVVELRDGDPPTLVVSAPSRSV
jgi:hypothetical protein